MCINHILLLILCACFSLVGWAQQQPSKRICDTIHYELIRDKIVIPVTVNGVKTKYIVDTGGQTGTILADAIEMNARRGIGARGVSDLNGAHISYDEAILDNVQLSPNYKLSQMKSMIFPPNGLFSELGVSGLLGSDAFAQSVVTFDGRNQLMIINYPYRPSGLKITDGVPIYPGQTNHPILDVDFGGIVRRILFDTGAGGFLSLSSNDYAALRDCPGNMVLAQGHGIAGLGIAGFDWKHTSDLTKVRLAQLDFVGETFHNVESVTVRNGMSIIGIDMLRYGKVIIDYMRNRFYFFPYDTILTDLAGQVQKWEVEILPVENYFAVTAVWGSMQDKISLGDRVIHINDTDLSQFPPSQYEVEMLMNKGTTVRIVILKNGKEQQFEIKRI